MPLLPLWAFMACCRVNFSVSVIEMKQQLNDFELWGLFTVALLKINPLKTERICFI
jgi:hypothetical protein